MMRHGHDDMGRVVPLLHQLDGIDDLPLADEQSAVVVNVALRQPCRVQSDNRQPNVVDRQP